MKACDVLVENFAPGVLDRMGFSWEAIQAIVHRSKSNLRYLGLHALLDLADEIEDDCGRPYRHHLLPGKVAHWLTGMERALEKTQELLHTTNR